MASFIHSTSPHLLNTAGVLSTFPLALGVYAIINPASGLPVFNIPEPTAPAAKKSVHNLMLIWASRDIFMSAVLLTAWYNKDTKMLGTTLLLAGGVAVADAVISWRQAGKDLAKHLGFVPVLVAVGGALLGWFDNLL